MASEDEPEDNAAYQAALNRMGNMGIADIIRAGHEALLRDLVARVNTGVATHQEKSILRNLLRDNGMTMGVAPTAPTDAPDDEDLPELADPDYR